MRQAFWIVGIALLLVCTPFVVAASANMTFINGTVPSAILYDRFETAVGDYFAGSDSYKDYSAVTDNLYLHVCHEDLSIGDKIDVVYTSLNDSIAETMLYLLHTVKTVSTISGSNCTYFDVQLAGARTTYPGTLSVVFAKANSTYTIDNQNLSDAYLFEEFSFIMNGSFDVGISVEGPPKLYKVVPRRVYADDGQLIRRNTSQLLLSYVNESGTILYEKQLLPGQDSLNFTDEILGGERVYINDLLALEIQTFTPCGVLNESGYFVMNESIFNYNETCVRITQTTDIVLNFAGELIDGDSNNTNGSMVDNTCAILIEDSQGVTIENLQTQDYYYGICILNSTVSVYGEGTTANFRGALVDEASDVYFVDLIFENNESEIWSQNTSTVHFLDSNISSARMTTSFRDLILRSAQEEDIPEPIIDTFPDLFTIGQFAEFINNSANSYAQINFIYDDPLPNNVSTDNVSIYKYRRGVTTTVEQNLTNETDNTTYLANVSTTTNGTWTQVFTLVSPSTKWIISPNITSFSIFAPYAETINTTSDSPDPEPDPTPDPTPSPRSGPGSGSGGSPAAPFDEDSASASLEPSFFELVVPENMTIMQGSVALIPFNLTNVGDADVEDLLVGPQPRIGWEYSNRSIATLDVDQMFSGNLSIAVYDRELPGTYFVPVTVFARDQEGAWTKILSEYVRVKVTPRATLRRLAVVEYPPEILYSDFDEIDVSFLVENIGDFDLPNITVVHDDTECLRSVEGETYSVAKGEVVTLDYTIFFARESECQTSLRFYSNDELVGFLPLALKPADGSLFDLPQTNATKLLIWSIALLVWSILTVLVIERWRKRRG